MLPSENIVRVRSSSMTDNPYLESRTMLQWSSYIGPYGRMKSKLFVEPKGKHLKEHDKWTWKDAVEYVSKSRLIYPAVEIKESILEYFESIENRRRE